MEHERTANALLLFYEKVRPRQFPTDDPDMEEACSQKQGTGFAASRESTGAGDGGKRSSSEPVAAAHPSDNMSTSTTESDIEGGAGEEKTAIHGSGVVGVGASAVAKVARGAGRRVGPGGVPLLDGVEAFSEEVWQANVQFMLNSYVFDTEFHHFLRRVLLLYCLYSLFFSRRDASDRLVGYDGEIKNDVSGLLKQLRHNGYTC